MTKSAALQPPRKPMPDTLHTIWKDDMGDRHYAYDPDHPEGIRSSICVEVEQMRCQFRGGELDAEYWRAELDASDAGRHHCLSGWFNDAGEKYVSSRDVQAWRDTVRRFATTPEYDQEDWPPSRANRYR